jgi:hypothetical protein
MAEASPEHVWSDLPRAIAHCTVVCAKPVAKPSAESMHAIDGLNLKGANKALDKGGDINLYSRAQAFVKPGGSRPLTQSQGWR